MVHHATMRRKHDQHTLGRPCRSAMLPILVALAAVASMSTAYKPMVFVGASSTNGYYNRAPNAIQPSKPVRFLEDSTTDPLAAPTNPPTNVVTAPPSPAPTALPTGNPYQKVS